MTVRRWMRSPTLCVLALVGLSACIDGTTHPEEVVDGHWVSDAELVSEDLSTSEFLRLTVSVDGPGEVTGDFSFGSLVGPLRNSSVVGRQVVLTFDGSTLGEVGFTGVVNPTGTTLVGELNGQFDFGSPTVSTYVFVNTPVSLGR